MYMMGVLEDNFGLIVSEASVEQFKGKLKEIRGSIIYAA